MPAKYCNVLASITVTRTVGDFFLITAMALCPFRKIDGDGGVYARTFKTKLCLPDLRMCGAGHLSGERILVSGVGNALYESKVNAFWRTVWGDRKLLQQLKRGEVSVRKATLLVQAVWLLGRLMPSSYPGSLRNLVQRRRRRPHCSA
jgi:hypothetical protein